MAVWGLCTHSDGHHIDGPLLGHKTRALYGIHSHLNIHFWAALFPGSFVFFLHVCIHHNVHKQHAMQYVDCKWYKWNVETGEPGNEVI